VITGFLGVLFAPNRGLFVYSPACLLVCALPFVWRRLSREIRVMCRGFGVAFLGYAILIASLKNWGGAFAWGPRYLLPMLPILVYASAFVLTECARGWRTRLFPALLILSACLSFAPVLVNWPAAIVVFPHALDQSAWRPYQQRAVWQELLWGLEGRPLPVPREAAADPERAAAVRFPDLWTVRLVEHSPRGWLPSLIVVLACGAVCVWCLRHLVAQPELRSVHLQAGHR
jgi:hypothetical protein